MARMFSNLVDGTPPQEGKKWHGENGLGRVYVVAACTGVLGTTSNPLKPVIGELTAEQQEAENKRLAEEAENLTKAKALITAMTGLQLP